MWGGNMQGDTAQASFTVWEMLLEKGRKETATISLFIFSQSQVFMLS